MAEELFQHKPGMPAALADVAVANRGLVWDDAPAFVDLAKLDRRTRRLETDDRFSKPLRI